MKVAIHNKNGQGLLLIAWFRTDRQLFVAIHNKNGQGLLQRLANCDALSKLLSQSTIKMDKGYYSFQ